MEIPFSINFNNGNSISNQFPQWKYIFQSISIFSWFWKFKFESISTVEIDINQNEKPWREGKRIFKVLSEEQPGEELHKEMNELERVYSATPNKSQRYFQMKKAYVQCK